MKGLINSRNVHYIDRGGFHQAAIIRNVVNKDEGIVHLVAFGSHDGGSIYFPNDVRFTPPEKEVRNSWHWPERDEEPVAVGQQVYAGIFGGVEIITDPTIPPGKIGYFGPDGELRLVDIDAS